MKERQVNYPGVGAVRYVPSKRARRVSLRIEPFRPVRVAVPLRCSFDEAETFVKSHLEWLAKQSAKIRKLEAEHLSTLHAEQGRLFADNPEPQIDIETGARRLIERTAQLAHRHGFTYNRLTIRNQKTRWGSCSHHNNLNLNIGLVRLRQELIDYVILHELTHTRVKNHSPKFWTELARCIPEPKRLDRELRKHLLTPFK